MSAVKQTEHFPWEQALIAKYDVPSPRYTSYPTALEFSAEFGAQQYIDQVKQLGANIAPLSLYFHIPFCENICYYCACNKVVTRQKEKARHYLNYLKKEIELQSRLLGKTRPVTQLHWGGGTPTFLTPAEMTELMHCIATHFKLLDSDSREYSIEIDPRTVERETLALIKGLGFNRISMGVQDFDPRVQEAVNRVQPFDKVKALCDAARSYAFKSLSFDLIYGLPYQSVASLLATLEKVLVINPDRISLYNYAHLPERFPTQRSIDRLTLPSAEEKIAMLTAANQFMTEHGYVYIGMDHFVKPHDDLARAQREGKLQRNFQGYSTCMAPDLIGIGMSAISSVNNCFAQNARTLDEYYEKLDRDELPIWRGIALGDEDKLRRFVIMELICNLHLSFAELQQRYHVDFNEHFARERTLLQRFADDGLLDVTNSEITIKAKGRPMTRNICMVFDEYLSTAKEKRFSKTL